LRTFPIIASALLLSACAATPPGRDAAPPKAETQAEAHRVCYQRMQAARAGALLTSPNWHQVRMCMQARGHPV